MWKKLCCFGTLWLALLALPFALRHREASPRTHLPPAGEAGRGTAEKLVIISAHNKAVRDEYSRAFRRYCREKFRREVELDFRSPGGTSDIVRYIADRYEAEFRRYCEKRGCVWNDVVRRSFSDPAVDRDPKASPEAKRARKLFLDSDVGIGIDIFAGGGTFDHARQAARGFGVDGGVRRRHPEYFDPAVIPPKFGGDLLYDPRGRYYGVVLSTFGIAYNADRVKEFRDATPPRRWRDLGDGRFFNTLAVADPSKSGSANKCFEIVLQQAMAEAGSPDAGWGPGFSLIKRIFANARDLTDSASKVVRDVGTGDAAAGMAIDTYGISESKWSARIFDGTPHCFYVTPRGGTAVGADPVQLLRGAPHRELAEHFIDFLLSKEGQRLHCFVPGAPGGPEEHSLNRPPVRRDLYTAEEQKHFFLPGYDPYRSGADFVYRAEWTGRYYSLLRVLLKAIALDPHPELRAAWRAILAAGGPERVPEAMKRFDALPFDYAGAARAAAMLRGAGGESAAEIAATVRSWSDFARRNYHEAERLAKEGR